MASLYAMSELRERASRRGGGESGTLDAERTIRLLQEQLRQSQDLIRDLRGQLNQAVRRD